MDAEPQHEAECRVCWEHQGPGGLADVLIQHPCACRGTQGSIHASCLFRAQLIQGSYCRTCAQQFRPPAAYQAAVTQRAAEGHLRPEDVARARRWAAVEPALRTLRCAARYAWRATCWVLRVHYQLCVWGAQATCLTAVPALHAQVSAQPELLLPFVRPVVVTMAANIGALLLLQPTPQQARQVKQRMWVLVRSLAMLTGGIWLQRRSGSSGAALDVAQVMTAAGLCFGAWELGFAHGEWLAVTGLLRGRFWTAPLRPWLPAVKRLAGWAAAAADWLGAMTAYLTASTAFSTRPWAEAELLRVLRL